MTLPHPAAQFLLGAGPGARPGHFGPGRSGTSPLTSTWWRGAFYGGCLGPRFAPGSRSP